MSGTKLKAFVLDVLYCLNVLDQARFGKTLELATEVHAVVSCFVKVDVSDGEGHKATWSKDFQELLITRVWEMPLYHAGTANQNLKA